MFNIPLQLKDHIAPLTTPVLDPTSTTDRELVLKQNEGY
jgi:hypothetical protein